MKSAKTLFYQMVQKSRGRAISAFTGLNEKALIAQVVDDNIGRPVIAAAIDGIAKKKSLQRVRS